jgi:uncharacterized Tic20 family protein
MSLLIDPGLEGTTKEERKWAMLSHATAMGYMFVPIPLPLGNLLGPLIIWGWKGRSSEFVRVHAARSVNFQIPMAILHAIVMALDLGLIMGIEAGRGGKFFVYMVVGFHMLMTICASLLAMDGRYWFYPLQIPVLKEKPKVGKSQRAEEGSV